MTRENISADLGELGGYAGKASGLSDEISAVAGQHLANQSVGADMLGDLGEESGLHSHIASSIDSLHGATRRSSGYVASLGDAVSGAKSDYVADEQLHADTFRGIDTD